MALRDLGEPTFRDRPVGLLVIAALSAIAGVAMAIAAGELFLGAARYADWMTPKLVGNDLVGMVQVYPEHYLLMGAILLVPALLLVAFAIGIARQRPWAWIIGFVAGGLIGLYGVLALVIPADLPSNADRWHLAAGVPWILLGVVLLRYFDRRPVRSDLGWGDASIG
jgi:hypothetical protein